MSLVKFKNGKPGMPSIWDEVFGRDLFDSSSPFTVPATNPAVNILENGEGYIIELAVPGYDKKDFQVEVDNDLMTVSATKESESEREDETYTRKEFNYAQFKRSFTLPETSESGRISANYDNGILRITVPKREEAKAQPARMIKVK